MARYVELDALVAEIERRVTEGEKVAKEVPSSAIMGLIQAYKNTLSFLDTLEVKEVDLEKELNNWRHNHFHGRRDKDASGEYLERISQLELAKYFFELGMAVSNKAQKG